ncbi:restriction endonuclease subunit S [Prevotella melaninogenica]|uniref:restriction endonuclease subunit S n=1 Tax=Prevotella melaninogenica TaxID=28132 RepID=UPI001CAE8C64|nr:restriction endonuclease subunit S [Prevotella melaninogenica]MBF1594922.1 restriction endonuclease subunit S [Prevotella sp.]
MREGWEYKTIEKCTSIEYGTRVVQKRDGGTIYPVYGGGGETFRMDRYNREDCLIIARFAMSPRCVRYVAGKFFLNDSGLSVKSKEELEQAYLNYHLLFFNDVIYHLGKGAAQRNLDVKAFRQLVIAIPPKSTQLSIVSELDKLNELIRIKKEQLKDYDTLAQSIFYEMFGDPVENEKGWEVKELIETVIPECKISYGIVQPGEHVEDGVPIVRPVDMLQTFISKDGLKKTTKEISNSYNRTILTGKELLICVRGTTGVVSLVDESLKGANVTRGIAPLLFSMDVERWFMYYQIKTPSVRGVISSLTRGIALKQINMSDLRKIQVILPPLPLQHSFAQKIEQIEQQKAAIQKTITDLETLLAARMQYWFD